MESAILSLRKASSMHLIKGCFLLGPFCFSCSTMCKSLRCHVQSPFPRKTAPRWQDASLITKTEMVYWGLWESAKTHSCNQWQNRMPWNPIIPHSPSSVQFPLMVFPSAHTSHAVFWWGSVGNSRIGVGGNHFRTSYL